LAHDWIAFKGFVLAGRPAFIKNNLNRYFIGTEAPDNGFKPPNADGGYNDASACHCILFDEEGNVTRERGELRVRQEFDKALQALADGDLRLAAFYAGALAHYMGDLGQFYHIMGASRIGARRTKRATVRMKWQSRARLGFRIALRPSSRASSHRLQSVATHPRKSRERLRCEQSEALGQVAGRLASWTSGSATHSRWRSLDAAGLGQWLPHPDGSERQRGRERDCELLGMMIEEND
jgi:hypothetical protein